MQSLPLVLGSTSIYRKAVLEKLGIAFITASPNIDETRLEHESPIELVRRLSELKAIEVAKQHPNSLIIGSDQVASFNQNLLCKPGNHDNAVKQLLLMSGHEITFHSGLCLLNSETKRTQLDVINFTVKMRHLSKMQIESYVSKDKPYDSAGSFKSEGLGIALFQSMLGNDPNSLIGLPLIRLIDMLMEEDFSIL